MALLLAGDAAGAVAAAGVSLRTLYRAKDAAQASGQAPAPSPPQKLVRLPSRAKAVPSPAAASPPSEPGALVAPRADPRRGAVLFAVGQALDADPLLLDVPPEELAARLAETEPTDEEIAALDTRTEAAKILIKMSRRVDRAPDVRLGTVAGKVLDAVNRLEQIDRRRPQPAAPDEVQEAIRLAMAESTEHLLRHTVPAAERWTRLLPRLRVALGIAAPDLLRELDTLTGGAMLEGKTTAP